MERTLAQGNTMVAQQAAMVPKAELGLDVFAVPAASRRVAICMSFAGHDAIQQCVLMPVALPGLTRDYDARVFGSAAFLVQLRSASLATPKTLYHVPSFARA